MIDRAGLLVMVVVLTTGGTAFAGEPCESDWECPGWTGCFFNECDTEDPGTIICDSSGQEGTGCPEGCECINDGCVCGGTSLVGCSTGADCAGSEDCVKGGCVEHDDGKGGMSGSCDAIDDCPQGQVCVRYRCASEYGWCKSDADCHEMESCALACVLYEYGPGGSFDGAKCILELGGCKLDLDKVELKSECDPFCKKIGPCWQEDDDGQRGSGSVPRSGDFKEDTLTDGSDMVLECKYMCSILLADPEKQAVMNSAIACLADEEGDCDALESACEVELYVAFGGQPTGGADAYASEGDVVSGGASPKNGGTGAGGGSCSAVPPASTSPVGVALLLLAAGLVLVHLARQGVLALRSTGRKAE